MSNKILSNVNDPRLVLEIVPHYNMTVVKTSIYVHLFSMPEIITS